MCARKKGANTSDSTAMSLIKMLLAGPEVSFSGSPTVSPMTAARWQSEPLPPSVRACSLAPAYRRRPRGEKLGQTRVCWKRL